MPALTITAVDNTVDQLTIPSHGLVTGDGVACVLNLGGVLPAPLAATDDVWVIRVDANTVKLATSSANALLGTAINLTTNGSGTNILALGLPYRRPRTYVAKSVSVPGSQLKSADINATFDSVIKNQKPTMQRQSMPQPVPFITSSLAWNFSGTAYLHTVTGDQWAMPLLMEAGDRIADVSLRVYGDGASDVGYTLAYVNATTQTIVPLLSGADNNRAASWGTLALSSLAAFTPHTMADFESLYLFVSAIGGAHRWSTIRWTYDRPPP